MECPYCKYENRDGVRYCSNCGKLMDPNASSSIPPSPALTAGTVTVGGGPGGGGTSRALTVGTPLQGGRYVIKKILGQGGMGAALLATDKRLDNKLVVIKELVSDSTDPARFKEDERNFKREVVTLAHLDHPLIPNVTDNFDEGSHYFMVQEYVEGENLEDRMERIKQPLKEREVLGYASEILDVLDYLSQQTPPVVHRDIKPANVIIGAKDKRAHLVDFGIARADVARNVKRKQTSALGTPGYAPPEQYQGNADPRSDLYALAATMHHLLTNRDPRDYPPFSYPPVRTVNSQLSPEVERLLTRALNNDITQRFQSAAAMKRAVDDILLKRYGVSGNISSYTLGTSGPIGPASAGATAAASASAASGPTVANQPPRVHQSPPVNPAPARQQAQPYQPGGIYSPPPSRQTGGNNVGRNFLLLVIVILLLFGVGAFALNYIRGRSTNPGSTGGNGTTTIITPGTLPANGIGVIKASNGEMIGVSDGTFAFDTNARADSSLKQQAADRLKAGDSGGAQSFLNSAIAIDSNDAEALIYLEDQRVVTSGKPYITIVVSTMLTGADVTVGRDNLQGAYVAQKEYNDGARLPNGVLVRLLIASSGSQAQYATTVANEIVLAAQSDHTIVGVMGWPFSSRALDAIGVLAKAQIPMVSQTASSDQLTGISTYFFRVAPSNQEQGVAGARYAEQRLNAKNVALFVDHGDSYSSSLAQDFSAQFRKDGGTVFEESYKVGSASSLQAPLQDALSHNPAPDLIYFSGYAKDASVLLTDLPTTGTFATLPVLGGDALYELGAYQSSARAAGFRLHFTSFAYPDEWTILGYANQTPRFFADYANFFDPNRQHTGSPYGFTRPDGDVMLSYDAQLALLNASSSVISGGKQNFTPVDLQQALTKIKGAQSFQGVSGVIAFDSQGNPLDKAFVLLFVDSTGLIKMENTPLGTFLKK